MRVKIFATLRQLMGEKDLEVRVDAGDTVRNVLEKLVVEYPAIKEHVLDDDSNLQGSIIVFINGRRIEFLDGLDSTVQESDQLALFPPVAGG